MQKSAGASAQLSSPNVELEPDKFKSPYISKQKYPVRNVSGEFARDYGPVTEALEKNYTSPLSDFDKMMRQLMVLQTEMIKGFVELKCEIKNAMQHRVDDYSNDYFEPLDSIDSYHKMKNGMTEEKMTNLVSKSH